jgi:hypothetical protein
MVVLTKNNIAAVPGGELHPLFYPARMSIG